ncbi:MAG: hypothetical protein H6765_00195 [Candidatus Peribacteria bacterium]|nr:MAG: hypothetical protein H6765_00195 [Candidatus Peribacteria bacterium]
MQNQKMWKLFAFMSLSIPVAVFLTIALALVAGVAAEKTIPIVLSLITLGASGVFAWWVWKNRKTETVDNPMIRKVIGLLQIDLLRGVLGAIIFFLIGLSANQLFHWESPFIIFGITLFGGLLMGFVVEDFDDEVFSKASETETIDNITVQMPFGNDLTKVQANENGPDLNVFMAQLRYIAGHTMLINDLESDLRAKLLRLYGDALAQGNRLADYWPLDIQAINTTDFFSSLLIEVKHLHAWMVDYRRQTQNVQFTANREILEKLAGFYATVRPIIQRAEAVQVEDFTFQSTEETDRERLVPMDAAEFDSLTAHLEALCSLLPKMVEAKSDTALTDVVEGNIINHDKFFGFVVKKEIWSERETADKTVHYLYQCYDLLSGVEFWIRCYPNSRKGGQISTCLYFEKSERPAGVEDKDGMIRFFQSEKAWPGGQGNYSFGGYATMDIAGSPDTYAWKCEYLNNSVTPPQTVLVLVQEVGSEKSTTLFTILEGIYLKRGSIVIQ